MMFPALKLSLNGFELRDHPLLRRDPPDDESSVVWFSLSTLLPVGHRFTQAFREYEYPAKSGRGSAEKNLPSAARRRTSRLRFLQSSSASMSRGIASDHNRLPKISRGFL
jgi:hypothetical protein